MSLILVVDDVAAIRDLMAARLRNAGYRTLCAANGIEALAWAVSEKPDLILLDLSMPVMDGMTCLATLRSMPGTASIPVILCTATVDEALIAQAARFRVKEYLLKSGVSVAELLSRVKTQLGNAEGNPPPALVNAPAAAAKSP